MDSLKKHWLILSFIISLLYLSVIGLINGYNDLYLKKAQNFFSRNEEFNFKIPADFFSQIKDSSYQNFIPKTKGRFRLLIISPSNIGEVMAARRMQKAAKNLGWEVCLIPNHKEKKLMAKLINPDLIISMTRKSEPINGFTNFLYIHEKIEKYLTGRGELQNSLQYLKNYDGFLSVNPTAIQLMDLLGKNKNDIIKTIFSSPKTEFHSLNRNELCYYGALWDKRRKKGKYVKLYRYLDNTNYFATYGPKSAWDKIGLNSYRGEIPYDDDIFRQTLQRHGISLVIHNDYHLKQNTLTARIFETISASTIVISDEHPMVKKYFGDSVLYFDHTKSSEEMFKQIDSHVQWIRDNPEEAAKKAQAAHSILVNNFIYEKELEKILAFYEKKQLERRKIGS